MEKKFITVSEQFRKHDYTKDYPNFKPFTMERIVELVLSNHHRPIEVVDMNCLVFRALNLKVERRQPSSYFFKTMEKLKSLTPKPSANVEITI